MFAQQERACFRDLIRRSCAHGGRGIDHFLVDEAAELADEIHQRIGEEWEWAKDLKEFGKEMARSQVELEKMRIEAARAIGEAYAENQPDITVNQTIITGED